MGGAHVPLVGAVFADAGDEGLERDDGFVVARGFVITSVMRPPESISRMTIAMRPFSSCADLSPPRHTSDRAAKPPSVRLGSKIWLANLVSSGLFATSSSFLF